MNNFFITQGWQLRGAEVALKNYIDINFEKENISIINLGNKPYSINSIDEYFFDFTIKNRFFCLLKLIFFLIQKVKIHDKIIYLNGKIIETNLAISFCKFFIPHVQFVLWEHCLIEHHWVRHNLLIGKVIKASYFNLLKISNKIIVPSNIISILLKRFQQKVEINPNPLIITLSNSIEPLKLFQNDCINLIYVGAFSEEKNPTMFLDFIIEAHKINKTIKGFMFGEGIQKDLVLDYINSKNANEYIIICPWKQNIHDFINNADYLIVTSKFETYCNVIMEALCLDCNVISTCWEGAKEIYGEKISYFEDYKSNIELIKSLNKREVGKHKKSKLIFNPFKI